ncbi:hypothetical protein ACFB49_22000 [Sphingomonas sp. DBB INV C78]|uniref:lasso peptide biosynthesis B2 protein n=1 Tax=Sphingomonas sp. DBB INV C78 TaxID=3349434 RepID=UPI0036D3DCBF
MSDLLREGVHVVAIHTDLVILDAPHDDYFCIVDALTDHGPDPVLKEGAAAALVDAGLLRATAGATIPLDRLLPAPMRDWHDLPPAGPVRITAIDVARFVAALIWSRTHFGRHRLPGLMKLLAGQGDRVTAPCLNELSAAVRKFQTMMMWLPVRPLCLFHSFLLLRFLRLSHLSADWIIGVQLYPFQAHCWLACGDIVVGDDAHRLGAYRPILVHSGFAR